jgi:hypothetical protein
MAIPDYAGSPIASALTSGVGYAICLVLPGLKTYAATGQLSVPVIAAVGGIRVSPRANDPAAAGAAAAILRGIALVVVRPQTNNRRRQESGN